MKKVILVILTLLSVKTHALSGEWQYQVSHDKLTDAKTSHATIYSRVRTAKVKSISFSCSGDDIRFNVTSSRVLERKGESFKVYLRADNKPAQKLVMKIFSNSNQGGYNRTNYYTLAQYLLGTNLTFVRIVAWDGQYYENYFPMTGSDRAIKQVFNDCDVPVSK